MGTYLDGNPLSESGSVGQNPNTLSLGEPTFFIVLGIEEHCEVETLGTMYQENVVTPNSTKYLVNYCSNWPERAVGTGHGW